MDNKSLKEMEKALNDYLESKIKKGAAVIFLSEFLEYLDSLDFPVLPSYKYEPQSGKGEQPLYFIEKEKK